MDRFRIPGAFHALPEVLVLHGDVPRDQEVVLYCSCPNEVTSARVAQQLRQLGDYASPPAGRRIWCVARSRLSNRFAGMRQKDR
jgi:rhodanese-related sulfurtransferase